MTRVIDNGSQGGACPVCNADKSIITTRLIEGFDKDGNPKETTLYYCGVCGYDESQQAKFPSHQE